MTSAQGSGVLRRARPSASGFSSLRRRGHCFRALLEMAAEALPHRGEDAVAEVGLAARGEPVEERGGEHRHWYALLDRGLHRPSALAGVAHVARVLVERRASRAAPRGQVEQPRGDHRAAPPELGDGRDVELVLVEVGVAQRRRLGVRLLRVQADVRVLEDVQALGVRLHQAVLDAVVDHLHEVARAGRAAVQPALLLGCRVALAAGGAHGGADAGCERLEHRREAADGLVVAADHQAVAALAAPDASADADVDVVDAPAAELGRAAQVVDVVRVAAVDDRVALGQVRRELAHDGVHDPCRHHHPHRPRGVELLHELLERARRARVDLRVERLDVMSRRAQALRHVRAHPAEADHSQLH